MAKKLKVPRAPKAFNLALTPGDGGLPTKDQIVQFLNTAPGKAGKREIARAFGLTAGAKIALKRRLAEMTADGQLAGDKKDLREPGRLPPTTTLEITGRDGGGDLLSKPVHWENDDGERPAVRIISKGTAFEGELGIGDRILARIHKLDAPDEAATYDARILKKLPRDNRRLLGIFRGTKKGGGSIEPISRKDLKSWSVLPGDDGNAADGDLVRFELVKRGRFHTPRATIIESLGNPSDQKQISLIAVHAHGIPESFPESVIAESEAVQPPDLGNRTDLRNLPLITIDPVDARDHDDAVHASEDTDPKNEGGWIVTVAIADVAHYIRPGSKLDREALLRGNSVYFPDRVVPMLPERISNNLCSLREGEERACLAVRMVFNRYGEKTDHTFMRGMMRSAAKLSYQEAQAAIDGSPSDKAAPLLDSVLKPLFAAFETMRKGRDKRGPLELDVPERRVLLDDNGHIKAIVTPERLDAHKLIEEMMIQANVAAAETLEEHRTDLVYRVHDQPSPEKLRNLRDFLETMDMKLPAAPTLRPSAFNGILARAKETPVPDLINEVILRSQSQAEYAPKNIGHFGLNLQRYAHFTSPIRRYADLIVHRALVRALDLGDDGLTDDERQRLTVTAKTISDCERRAMMAERETTDRLIAAFLMDRVGASFNARISGVTRTGLFVRLKDTGADGYIPAGSLGDEYYQHIEASHALVGTRSGAGYRLGDDVEVRLLEVLPHAGAMRFEMLSSPKGGHFAALKAGSGRPPRNRFGAPGGSKGHGKGGGFKPRR